MEVVYLLIKENFEGETVSIETFETIGKAEEALEEIKETYCDYEEYEEYADGSICWFDPNYSSETTYCYIDKQIVQ